MENVSRMMRKVFIVIPADAAEWFKQKQYLDKSGNFALLDVLEARILQERKRSDRIFYASIGLLVLLILVLKFLVK